MAGVATVDKDNARPSPCSQFFPPNPSGHSHRYVFHLLTQAPPF